MFKRKNKTPENTLVEFVYYDGSNVSDLIAWAGGQEKIKSVRNKGFDHVVITTKDGGIIDALPENYIMRYAPNIALSVTKETLNAHLTANGQETV